MTDELPTPTATGGDLTLEQAIDKTLAALENLGAFSDAFTHSKLIAHLERLLAIREERVRRPPVVVAL